MVVSQCRTQLRRFFGRLRPPRNSIAWTDRLWPGRRHTDRLRIQRRNRPEAESGGGMWSPRGGRSGGQGADKARPRRASSWFA